jgi:hypothetical protein
LLRINIRAIIGKNYRKAKFADVEPIVDFSTLEKDDIARVQSKWQRIFAFDQGNKRQTVEHRQQPRADKRLGDGKSDFRQMC